jgi:CspA family cold shock protein
MSTRRSVVKWFDAKKGYGFIVHPEGGTDIFVHYSAIETDKRFRTLRTGQVVEFELSDGPKGLHAANVVPADQPDQLPADYDDEMPLDVEETRPRTFGSDPATSGSIRAAL